MNPIALLAVAAVLEPQHPPPVPRVETLVVTAVASRRTEPVEATPATVTVIEREELERSLSHDIRDALRYEPGVSVENGPARFGVGNIAIRGLDGNRVQMMQDGIRLPDGFRIGSFSNANRNPFELSLLSRIEILRGPGSALYGSDALAGVVSTTTLDPRDLLDASRLAGFGETGVAEVDHSSFVTGAAATRAGRFELLAAASASKGHERDNRGENDVVGIARTTPNPQDTRATSGLAKIAYVGSDGARTRFTWDRYDRRIETDVLSLNPQSVKTVILKGDDRAERSRVSLDGEVFSLGFVDRLSWLAYGQDATTTQDTLEERANTTAQCLSANGNVRCRREARFRFEQEERGLTVIAESAIGKSQQLVYGAEATRGTIEEIRDGRQTNLNTGQVTNVVGTDVFPTRDFPRSRVDRIGAFAQDSIAVGPATIIPALRFDRFSMKPEADALYSAANPGRTPVALTDSAWSPKLGTLVPVSRYATLSLQYATGFRAPPYYDANIGTNTMPLGYAIIPNPDLKPEKSRGMEAGVRGRIGHADYSITAYRTDYSDLIVSRAPLPCPGDPRCVPGAPITFQSQNVTRARIEGIEARVAAAIAAGWSARAGGAYARGEDRSKNVPLNSVDPPKVVAGAAYESPDRSWGGEATLTHAWEKKDIDTSAGKLIPSPAYTTVDLTAFLKVTRDITVHAGVFNVTDQKYWLWSDIRGLTNLTAGFDRYTQPGRNASVSVKIRF